ncbi:hypothetical protein BD626DRAFT_569947 [Schizophyllum amplum]|uniref:Uncharacterized protein n=1 Tax=Schizophyllum amplum TaxID=97359 RepID=A0A550CBN2_9AGAR|nr:hypothetical protein BD626DRAFT_569947 [Auriculariopsis ampla]
MQFTTTFSVLLLAISASFVQALPVWVGMQPALSLKAEPVAVADRSVPLVPRAPALVVQAVQGLEAVGSATSDL